jgi:hypothetical protein
LPPLVAQKNSKKSNREIMMTRTILIVATLCTSSAFAQVSQVSTGSNSPNIANVSAAQSPAPPLQEITVKSSPAQDTLVNMAKQQEEVQKVYDNLFQQARSNLDAKNKPLLDEIKARSAKWQVKIDADTKDLRDKLNKNQADAQDAFNKEMAPLAAKGVSPQTITTLEDLVKQEQNLPSTAHFDLKQKKWFDTAKK